MIPGQANGFFGSKGVSRFIPPAYTYFSQRFYEQVDEYTRRKRRDEPRVEMSEWKRDGWTYHAKGAFTFLAGVSPVFACCAGKGQDQDQRTDQLVRWRVGVAC